MSICYYCPKPMDAIISIGEITTPMCRDCFQEAAAKTLSVLPAKILVGILNVQNHLALHMKVTGTQDILVFKVEEINDTKLQTQRPDSPDNADPTNN